MYITIQDIKDRFGKHGIMIAEDGVSEDIQTMTHAIEFACLKADSYLRSANLETPLTDPEAIKMIKGSIMDMYRYNAYSNSATDEIKERNANAIKWLEQVAAGKVRIVTPQTESRKGGLHNVRIVRS